mgnify:CR=1 FL=1
MNTPEIIAKTGYAIGTVIYIAVAAVALSFYLLTDWIFGYGADQWKGGAE